jgi:nucleoside-diphosphate-sugar epimerase
VILVTGSTGFIGRALVPELIDRGYELAVLVNKTPPHNDWVDRVKVLTADITKEADIFKIKDYPITKIIHLAAYISKKDSPEELENCLKVNVIGTNNLLEFARMKGINRFINSSSAIVYGVTEKPKVFKENSRVFPTTYYGMSKLLGEMLCERYRKIAGIKTISLRYSYIYGPGMPEYFVFGKFLNLARKGEDVHIYGTGKGVRDFIYVKDVISAIMLALESEAVGCYNIGRGISISLSDLAESIIRVTASKSRIIFEQDKKEDKSQPILDISKARKRLGFNPVYTLEEGLKDFLRDSGS